jgi:TPR repeat protein/serine/threonine protein kinase
MSSSLLQSYDIPDAEERPIERNWDAHLLCTEEYEQERVLGAGRFGQLSLCYHRDDPTHYYVCRIIRNPDAGPTAQEDRYFYRELDVYVRIRPHPAICDFIGCSFCPPWIVTEYLPNGSLADILEAESARRPFPQWTPTRRAKTIFGFATAMMHLHAHDAIHRYLTPQNILFTANWEAKLVDFGFACAESDVSYSRFSAASDVEYEAPEIIRQELYGPPVDVYAFGVIVYRIATGQSLFPPCQSLLRLQNAIVSGNTRDITGHLSGFLLKLLPPCWSVSAERRPTFYEIVRSLLDCEDPLFEGVDMNTYRRYRDLIWSNRYIPPAFQYVFENDILQEADIRQFEVMKARADRGDWEAQGIVGHMYQNGHGVRQDWVEARRYYELAAMHDDRRSQCSLGLIYWHGLGIDRNLPAAAEWFARASQDGQYVQAHVNLASLLLNGAQIPMKCDELIALLKADADPPVNHGLAQFYLSRLYRSGPAPNLRLGRHYLECAHRSGINEATSDLATMMLQGNPSPADFREAVRIYGQAADRGSGSALLNLGILYEKGRPCAPSDFVNPEKAKELFRRGAENGHAACCLHLGTKLYQEATSNDEDPVWSAKKYQEAARWFKFAGDLGSGVALHNYAKMKALGQGGPVDMNAAIDGLITAAENGVTRAYQTLADLVRTGHGGLRANPELAARLHERYRHLESQKSAHKV